MELASAKTTIGGRRVGAGESFGVANPATEAPWAVAPQRPREQ
jgi:hypothetical protein